MPATPLPANLRLVCPHDHQILQGQPLTCGQCGFVAATATPGEQPILDLRPQQPLTRTLNHRLPYAGISRDEALTRFFQYQQAPPPNAPNPKLTSKLDTGHRFYCQQAWEMYGNHATVLDLGCGRGENRQFLTALGFDKVVQIDWWGAGAQLLADAHTLPFEDNSFQLILSTAVFEHLAYPYLALREVQRVLAPGGFFVSGASFWESWHASSYFHFTPGGWQALCDDADLNLVDLWVGWGVIPALFSHYLLPGHLKGTGRLLQRMLDGVYRGLHGPTGLRKLQLRAAGSYNICARKPNA